MSKTFPQGWWFQMLVGIAEKADIKTKFIAKYFILVKTKEIFKMELQKSIFESLCHANILLAQFSMSLHISDSHCVKWKGCIGLQPFNRILILAYTRSQVRQPCHKIPLWQCGSSTCDSAWKCAVLADMHLATISWVCGGSVRKKGDMVLPLFIHYTLHNACFQYTYKHKGLNKVWGIAYELVNGKLGKCHREIGLLIAKSACLCVQSVIKLKTVNNLFPTAKKGIFGAFLLAGISDFGFADGFSR